MSLKIGQAVKVVGPENSAQAGKAGKVVSFTETETTVIVTVQLDGETRPRNFQPKDLKGV